MDTFLIGLSVLPCIVLEAIGCRCTDGQGLKAYLSVRAVRHYVSNISRIEITF